MNKISYKLFVAISVFAAANAHSQLEPDMALLPADCVEIGSMLMDQRSNPLREVCLDSFYIGKYEVTFEQFDEFTRETGLGARNDLGFGRETRPVVDVNWFDAFAYAQWLSEKTGETYRLPTDAEWEYAARAGAEFGFKYHWGAQLQTNLANCKDCGS